MCLLVCRPVEETLMGFSRRILNDKLPTRPLSKLDKHGYTCIYLPLSKDIAISLFVWMLSVILVLKLALYFRHIVILLVSPCTDRGYFTSKYVLESSTFTGLQNYSNHVVAGRFFCESLAPCSGLLNMRSTLRLDAREKFRYYRGKRAGIRQKQRILNKFWSTESVNGGRVHPTEKK